MGIGLLAAWVAGGCAAVLPTPVAPSLSSATVALPTPSVDPSARIAVDISPAASGNWGPLAVIPPQDGSDSAPTQGTLRITDTCVFLDGQDEPMLLLWPADQTRWDEGTRAVTFGNVDGTAVVVKDGAVVVLGGSGDRSEESGIAPEVWLQDTRKWTRPRRTVVRSIRTGSSAHWPRAETTFGAILAWCRAGAGRRSAPTRRRAARRHRDRRRGPDRCRAANRLRLALKDGLSASPLFAIATG